MVGQIEFDPSFKTDRLASALMEFPGGQALFVCSTQLVPYQRMQIFGTKGRIEIEIPFNAPPDRPCRIFVDDGSQLGDASAAGSSFEVVDQYTLQGDAFARAIRDRRAARVPARGRGQATCAGSTRSSAPAGAAGGKRSERERRLSARITTLCSIE